MVFSIISSAPLVVAVLSIVIVVSRFEEGMLVE
jgi:hypothetical protein